MKKSDNNTSLVSKILKICLLVVGGISLFFAQSSLWVNSIIFDQQAFTNTTTEVILSQKSRDSIAQAIVDRAFDDRPVADRLIGDRAVTFVSGLLGSDISDKVLTRIASSGYQYLTSSDRQDVVINLSSIRDPLAGIISFAESRGREVKFDINSIPEQIVLIDSDELPDVASYIRLLIIASFFLWLTVILSFGTYIILNKKDYIKSIYIVGTVIIGTSLVSLMTGPFVPPVVSSFVNNIQLRGVVSDLTSAYLQPFISQMYLTIVITALLLLAIRFRWIFVSSWNATYKSVNQKIGNKQIPKPKRNTPK